MIELVKDIETLRTASEPLKFLSKDGADEEEGNEIVKKLKDVLTTSKDMLAIAAPQIGINKRIFCIKFNDVIKTFINPIITKKEGCVIAPETFINFPGKEILIARPKEVTVVYYNDLFKYEDNKLTGLAARLFDQYAQLLDGVLPDELGLVSDIEQDGSLADATDEEMEEYIKIYKQFVSTKTKALESEIKEDEADEYKKLKFYEDVINGRTKVMENPNDPHPQHKLNRKQRRDIEKQVRRLKSKKAGGR